MKQKNLSIRFFIVKARTKKNGEAPIMLRLTLDGAVSEIRVLRDIEPRLWDQKKGLSKGRDRSANELNTYLQELHSKAFKTFKDLSDQQAFITPELVLKKVFQEEEQPRTVLKSFKEHNDEMYSLIGIDYEKITWRRYDVCYRRLQEVIKLHCKKDDITFHEFNRELIKKLEGYLKKEMGLCTNTIVRYMKCIKKLTTMALANDWMRNDPFVGLKYKQPQTNPVFLTMEELDRIRNYDFSMERLNLVRDTFIFCCYTGLAFSDAKELTPEHLFTDNNGKLWIMKERKKMRRNAALYSSNIPLMKTAQDILEKYKGNKKSIARGVCLPLYSNQKMNDYLKEIADYCKINKKLTTHVARHRKMSFVL